MNFSLSLRQVVNAWKYRSPVWWPDAFASAILSTGGWWLQSCEACRLLACWLLVINMHVLLLQNPDQDPDACWQVDDSMVATDG